MFKKFTVSLLAGGLILCLVGLGQLYFTLNSCLDRGFIQRKFKNKYEMDLIEYVVIQNEEGNEIKLFRKNLDKIVDFLR